MKRWLSFDETCIELRLGEKAVRNMLRSGQLVGYQVTLRRQDPKSRGKMGAWRILDPGAKFARYLKESERHLEHVPLLSGREVALVLGLKSGTIRQLKKRGRLQGEATTNGTLYTVDELRRLLLRRESKAEGRKVYSPTLGRWAQGLVAQDATVQAEVLDELLKQAIGAAEPLKSKYVVEIWGHFDAVDSMLRSAKLGEGMARGSTPHKHLFIAGLEDRPHPFDPSMHSLRSVVGLPELKKRSPSVDNEKASEILPP
jgi:hypothetical protein